MATKQTGKDIAAAQNTAMAEYAGYEEFEGSGFENQSSDDYALPFIHILQSNSPQVEDSEDLRAGMLINTVTGEVYSGKDGIAFVPACTEHKYVEWRPREQGGGFVNQYETNDPMVVECLRDQPFGSYKTPDGNELLETFYVYGIAIDPDDQPFEAVLAFTSTKIKKYKGWMTKAKTIQIQLPNGRRIVPPLFSHRYRLKTMSDKNKKGTFANWDAVVFDGENAADARLLSTDPLFQAANNIKNLIQTGKARAAVETQTPGRLSSSLSPVELNQNRKGRISPLFRQEISKCVGQNSKALLSSELRLGWKIPRSLIFS